MINQLNPYFLSAVEHLVEYVLPNEETHFLENPEDTHIYLKALKARYFLGKQDVSTEVAIAIILLNEPPFIVLGKPLYDTSSNLDKFPYLEVTVEDLIEDKELTENWEKNEFIIELNT